METSVGSAVEDYLKAIYHIANTEDRVTPTRVSQRLGVSAAAVVKMAAKLQGQQLILYDRKQGLRLTPGGQRIAIEVVRHHRLIELYLVEALGYSWDEVHEEAERLEHVISATFEEKIDRLLDHPRFDPHGDPIPGSDGEIERSAGLPLPDLEPGVTALIRRVTDGNASLLRSLGELGMYPGAIVEVIEEKQAGGPLHVTIDGREHRIDREIAKNVFVAERE